MGSGFAPLSMTFLRVYSNMTEEMAPYNAGITQEEFLNLVWRLEEKLMQLDYLRGRIGQCPDRCEGLDAEHEEGLCPTCCDWFEKALSEERRLAEDKEFNEIMEKLNRACDGDTSGTYQRILDQSRDGKAIH
jgi:hypothetical protein